MVFLRFIKHLIPDPVEREWFYDWLSHKFKNPHIPGAGVLMVAKAKGTGRTTTLFIIMEALFGVRYVEKVDSNQAFGDTKFNGWIARAVVVLMDEVLNDTAGDWQWKRDRIYESVKSLIDPGARRKMINDKYITAHQATVYASFIMATNNPNALPVEEVDNVLAGLTGDFVSHKVIERLVKIEVDFAMAPQHFKALLSSAVTKSSWHPLGRKLISNKSKNRLHIYARDEQAKALWEAAPLEDREALMAPNDRAVSPAEKTRLFNVITGSKGGAQ